jgi:hypothetical protein
LFFNFTLTWTSDDVIKGNQIVMNESVPLSSFARCSVRFCLLVGIFVFYEQVLMTMCFMFVICDSFWERERNKNKLDIVFCLLCLCLCSMINPRKRYATGALQISFVDIAYRLPFQALVLGSGEAKTRRDETRRGEDKKQVGHHRFTNLFALTCLIQHTDNAIPLLAVKFSSIVSGTE